MFIDASLFAHIENDSSLTGTYKLQGNYFKETVGYLNHYLSHLGKQKEYVPPEYLNLFQDLQYLVDVEEKIKGFKEQEIPNKLKDLSASIATDLEGLPIGKSLLLPGGWNTKDGGHAMVYQFTREVGGYNFTVINSGSKIESHEKKSSLEKELFNPTKPWNFPTPQSKKEKDEVAHFVERLLKPRIPAQYQKKLITGDILYNEIIPSISHIKGVEIATKKIPEHAYTAGQLSGTCAQRVLHQLLKILTQDSLSYQRFIFKFKEYALFDYATACLTGKQPFNLAVKNQINLAIENNLKIINTPDLFSEREIQSEVVKLKELQQKLAQSSFPEKIISSSPQEKNHAFTLTSNPIVAPNISVNQTYVDKNPLPLVDLKDGKDLLSNLNASINAIQSTENPAAKLVALENLLLKMPLFPTLPNNLHFYKELRTMDDFALFNHHLNSIQTALLTLQNEWLNKEPNPRMNILLLSILSLQESAHKVIPSGSNLPSFEPFSKAIMKSLVGNQARNPFFATNDPVLDQRFLQIQEYYKNSPLRNHEHYFDYYKELLNSEPELKVELNALYEAEFGTNTTELHDEIRNKGLRALFLISNHYNNNKRLDGKFTPLINKIVAHIEYESTLRKAINPFYVTRYLDSPWIRMAIEYNQFRVNTPLFPSFVPFEKLLTTLPKSKYAIEDSPALNALERDVSESSSYAAPIAVRTANHIQLRPAKKTPDAADNRPVTQQDIMARDYFHLRSEPTLQIPLTLDYFSRNIEKLAEESNQRYVEANLFQPGLLIQESLKESFLPQFDSFLKVGLRFFTENGQHTRDSILYLRLNYLVSRYLFLNKNPSGIQRLNTLQEDLRKQLSLENRPEITYELEQYLFLTLMTQINMGNCSEEIFSLAFKAYTYINSHTNPLILEDKAHRLDVDCTFALFQLLMREKPDLVVKNAVTKALCLDGTKVDDLKVSGSFPTYIVFNTIKGSTHQFNALKGKLFDQGLAQSGVPLTIQNHPLIKELGLDGVKECLMSADETYMVLPEQEVYLFHNKNNLTPHKSWAINGKKQNYELQALTKDHRAYHANPIGKSISPDLPKVLIDGTFNYWHGTSKNYLNSVQSANSGLLVQNNVPIYSATNNRFLALDSNGNETGYHLSKDYPALLKVFESTDFMINHTGANDSITKLPRYNLIFELKNKTLTNQETGEQVVERPPTIHPAVAGLVLANKEQQRFIVPIARFYPTEIEAVQGDFYPVIHDIYGTIAQARIEHHLDKNPVKEKPMWHYPNSEQYTSFQLKNGEPVAANVADALYLAYIYLSTNQTEKAWKILEECTTRFGGLTGDPAEVKYIAWICKDLPHILPSDKSNFQQNKPIKETPPYVACKLKAMSMLCDFQIQNGTIHLKQEKKSDDTTNTLYESINNELLQKFLTSLPTEVYQSFSRFQSMRRHLEHTYTLSTLERKRLLNYYQNSQPKSSLPQGALGYEWLSLNLEALLEERDGLLAQQTADNPLSQGDKNRLDLIQKQLRELKPVVATSTQLEQVPLDLSLAGKSDINKSRLNPDTIKDMELWYHKLPGDPASTATITTAINQLSSKITDDEFVRNFPIYFQIARSADIASKKELLDFCKSTLIASRHVTLEQQESDIPFLCNVLYRVSNTFIGNHPYKFNELVNHLKHRHVPELMVYQAKDIYKDILITPEKIIERKRPPRKPIRTTIEPSDSLFKQVGLSKNCDKNQNELLERLFAQYQELEIQNDEALGILGQKLNKDIDEVFKIEEQAGRLNFNLEQNKRKLAAIFIDNPQMSRVIISAADSASPELKVQIQKTWSSALALANQGPEEEQRARKWAIEKDAKARPALSQSDLLLIYMRADVAYSIEKTGLSIDKVQELHHTIHNALVKGIRLQSLEKISTELKDAVKTKDINAAAIALDVLSRKEIPGLDSPATVLIQHEDQILLRKRQVSALNSLLKKPKNGKRFNETIEKIKMGGGKSKVILPVLAEMKAQGDNLVVIEVPQALLKTNHVDLNSTSQRLFGKRAYRFEFNRYSASSADDLKKIYELFIEIINTRAYLVTTGESIESLELKYSELLLSTEKHDEAWKNQVYWADKINNLLRHHADCLIDEVHQGLSLKKRLNYTSGKPKPLSPLLIKNAVALFGFIDVEFIKQAPSLAANYDWTPFKTDLATKLIENPSSPLNEFVKESIVRFGPDIKAKLIDYLCNRAKTMPNAVLTASDDVKESLGFFKQEINARLPQTLPQTLDKNYGASKRKDLTAIEKTIAIPYAGSHVPNERNRFKDEIEAINKTMQMMLIKGINKDQLIERVQEWQALAKQELFQAKDIKHMDDTPTAKGFALLTSGFGLKLSQVNHKNNQQMSDLHTRFQSSQPLIFDFLREYSLPNIQQDSAILPSDSFNHVDQYRSVQGVAGTPSLNNAAYHQRLHYDKTSSLGSDGYLFEVMRNKNTPISSCDYDNASQFINTILSRSKNPKHTRAIIDIKGTFTGVNNYEVAQEIVRFIKKNPNHFSTPLKHILYFNDDLVLCALDVNKPNKPIVIGTSEAKVLNELLESTPDERFTFYDEFHKTGTDIVQAKRAHSIVLADDKTIMDEFLQGASRFREQDLDQTMEIVVPKRMDGISLDELGAHFKANEKQGIAMDAPSAAQGQMKNHIRRKLLSIVQDLPSEEADKKSALLNHFKPLFEDSPSLNLFALYGGINKEETIKAILEHYKNQMKTLWENQLKAAGLPPHAKEIEQISKELEIIIERTIPYCLPKYDSMDLSFNTEVEVQKEKEVQIEVSKINETYQENLQEQPTFDWPHTDYTWIFSRSDLVKKNTLSLNELCMPPSEKISVFSRELMASRNYAVNYMGQTEFTGGFLKPVFLVWYHMIHNDIHAVIITPQEAKQLERRFNNQDSRYNWISTTDDTVTFGFRPNKILLNEDYQSLREQVRFFNGEFSSLLNQESPLLWMKDQPVKKIDFFKSQLQTYRPGSETMLHQLEVALTQGSSEGFEYIAKHPFDDLTQTDWQKMFPQTIPPQAMEYKKIAEVFVYLNENWEDELMTVPELRDRFKLPMNTLVYVSKHLDHLLSAKQIIGQLKRILHHSQMPALTYVHFLAYLNDLPLSEKEFIKYCLGMSMDDYCYQHKIPVPTLESLETFDQSQLSLLSIDSIKLLKILNSHPLLKSKTFFNTYFENITNNATSPEELQALATVVKPTDQLFQNIANHDLFNDSLVIPILSGPIELSEETLVPIAEHCKTPPQIELIFKQKNLNQLTLQMLIGQTINKQQLTEILNRAKSEALLERVAFHPLADESIHELLFKHDHLSSKLLLKLVTNKSLKPDEISVILKHRLCKNPIRVALLDTYSLTEEQLLTVFEHRMDDTIIEKIYTNPSASEKVHIAILNSLTLGSLLPILTNHQLSENEILKVLVRFISNENIVDKILQQKKLTDKVFIALLKDYGINKNALLEIFNHPSASDKVRGLVLSHDLLSSTMINGLIRRPNIQEKEIIALLAHPNANLAEIYNDTESNPLVRKLLVQHPSLSSTAAKTILSKNKIAENELLSLIENPKVITRDLLYQIAKISAIGSEVLLAIVNHSVDNDILGEVLSQQNFNLLIAEAIIAKPYVSTSARLSLAAKIFELDNNDPKWETDVTRIFGLFDVNNRDRAYSQNLIRIINRNQSKINASLGLKFFTLLGKQVLDYLPLIQMIREGNNEEIGTLIEVDTTYSNAQLTEFVYRPLNGKKINVLLNRQDMTSDIADQLFASQEYDGTIGAWHWLTRNQLLATLNNASDYNSLKLALTHGGLLSNEDHQKWLDSMQTQQEQMLLLSLASSTIEDKLTYTLNALKIKACNHAVEALHDQKYEQVAKDAFTLYHTLHTEMKTFVADPATYSKEFKKNCIDAIKQVEPVLKQHRGYKQALLDIINVIFAVTALFRKGGWRFFEADTASIQTVNKIIENIDLIVENRGAINDIKAPQVVIVH